MDIKDPKEFRANWKQQEAEGNVDAEGASEWRYEVAFAVMRQLGVEVPESGDSLTWPIAEWLEGVLWYVQEVGMGR